MKWAQLVAICRRLTFTLGLAFTLLGLEGCQPDPSPRLPPRELDRKKIPYSYPGLGITIDNYPRMDGSTSTQPLQMILTCKVFGLGSRWFHDEDDTRALFPRRPMDYDHEFNQYSNEFVQKMLLCDHVRDLVQPHGTSEAYLNLIEKRADLIFVARLPSDDERILAGKFGVQLDARPVALDAFVFLLNGENPIESLTIEQIRDIYSGRIVNWREAGGPDAPIRPYQRPRNSGSQELMQRLVMKGRAMIEARDLLRGGLMSGVFLALDDDVDGIGYSVYYYQEFMGPQKSVKACAVDGVLPTSESIRSRRYPLLAEVYVVVCLDLPRESPAYRLRDWLLGPAGQGVVEESGYVAVRD
jgi:phosphate transport system substrate-binding protein